MVGTEKGAGGLQSVNLAVKFGLELCAYAARVVVAANAVLLGAFH